MKIHTHPIILSILLFCFAAGAFFVGHMALSYATFQATENFCVLLDAGHGGADPGKVSASGIKEKDINLAITLKCKSVLEQNGIKVILTRSEDQSLEDGSSSNKKSSDLKKRKALIKESKINCAVSIHQNSFPDSSSCGAQVFYHPNYPESKRLAGLIQAQMHSLTGIENHRKIKANTDYYLLRDNDTGKGSLSNCYGNYAVSARSSDEFTIDIIRNLTIQECIVFSKAFSFVKSTI